MIGQKSNIETLIKWRLNKSVPRFIIIHGNTGSGRLTLAKVIMKTMGATGVILGNSIENVREAIDNAYTVTETTFYIFRNADDMRTEAKNALLKVVEEPPNNAYFIMTVQNIDNMLGTIKSRGTLIKMQPYSLEEKMEFTEDERLLKYCSNIGQMKDVDKNQLDLAVETVKNVISGLSKKSGTIVLKSCTILRTKQTETEKLDCNLFMRVFEHELPVKIMSKDIIESIEICKYELQRSTINKKFSIECMLLRILEDMKNG